MILYNSVTLHYTDGLTNLRSMCANVAEGSGTIGGTPVGNGPPGSFWQIGTSTGSGAQDIKPHLPSLGLQTGTMDVKNEDVEVMSTDSSSSSSSDSQ